MFAAYASEASASGEDKEAKQRSKVEAFASASAVPVAAAVSAPRRHKRRAGSPPEPRSQPQTEPQPPAEAQPAKRSAAAVDLDVFRVQRLPSQTGLQQRAAEALRQRASAAGNEAAPWTLNASADADNLRFAAPYKKDVPAYVRVSRGRFLLGHDKPVVLPPPVHCKSDSKAKGKDQQPEDGEDAVGPATKRYYQLRLRNIKAVPVATAGKLSSSAKDAPLVRTSRWDRSGPASDAADLYIPIKTEPDATPSSSSSTTADRDAAGAATGLAAIKPTTSFYTTFDPAAWAASQAAAAAAAAAAAESAQAAMADQRAAADGTQTDAAAVDSQSATVAAADQDLDLSEEQRIQQLTAQFNRRLRENPRDAEAWKAYIKFQEQSVPVEVGASHKLAAILVDRRLDLYEQALQQLPRDEDLLADYMRESRAKLSPDELDKKWEQILASHAGSQRLWQEYLLYAVSSLSRFRVADVQSKYVQCLAALDSCRAANASAQRQLPSSQLEETLLNVVLQAADFLAQAGFQERQTAILQALCEVNLRLPPEFSRSSTLRGEPLHYLEAFWESGAPRFGEPQAVGFGTWLQYRKAGQPLPLPAAKDRPPQPPNQPARLHGLTSWQRWLEVECFREHNHWQSWRPSEEETEDDCEDVDRLVVFDDVMGHLFRLTNEDAMVDLVLTFASTLGASLPARRSSSHPRSIAEAQRLSEPGDLFEPLATFMSGLAASLYQDVSNWTQRVPGYLPLVNSGDLDALLTLERDSSMRPTAARVSGMAIGDLSEVWGALLRRKPLKNPSAAAPQSNLESVLQEAPQGWLPRPWTASEIAAPSGRAHMVLRVLGQALACLPHRLDLRLAYIDVFEAVDASGARKATKVMLKQPDHRNNLRLFARYAKLEASAGRPADAMKVFMTTLQMASATGQAQLDAVPEVCWDLVSWLLNLQSEAANSHALVVAVGLLLGGDFSAAGAGGSAAAPDPSVPCAAPAPTVLARARKALQRLLDEIGVDALLASGSAASSGLLAKVSCGLVAALLLDGRAAFDAWAQAALQAYKQAQARLDSPAQPPATAPATDSGATVWRSRLQWEHERLVTRWLRLLLWDMRQQRRPPGQLRGALNEAVSLFPYNPEFLTCWLMSEGRLQLASRVQSQFAQLLADEVHRHHPILWLFAIAGEVLRPAGASAHRVRALLQRAVQTRAARCPLLWRMYMEFERVQTGLDGPTRARNIFYQALQHCPGSKVLYLDVARHTPRQLQEVLDILQEKELHLRTPLEELELIEAEVGNS